MADIITNIANAGEYDTWRAAVATIPSDDGDVRVANFTVAGDYVGLSDMDTVNVAFRIQADPSVAYDFSNPTAAHVAFTETTGSAFDVGNSTTAIEVRGIRFETADTSSGAPMCIEANNFIDQNITVRNCRVIGGQNGVKNRTTAGDVYQVLNSEFSGQGQAGIWLNAGTSTVNHCTVHDSNTSSGSGLGGLFTRTGVTVSNTVAFNNNLEDFALTESTHTNCASGDNTASGTAAITGVVAADFTNTGAGIYTAAPTGVLAGAGTGGTDIGIEQGVANSIMITSPSEWTLIQRNTTTNSANITVTGTYSGDVVPTAIEYSYDGGAFAVLDASPAGGTFSGTITGAPSGNGTLTVRYTNDTSITTSNTNIAVGMKVLIPHSQSNMVGVATNAQTYTGTAGFFHKFTYSNNAWQQGADPFLTATNQGSFFPILANLLVADKGIPVGFVDMAEGSTTLAQWQSGQSLNTRMLDYITNSGGNDFEFAISWIGESDAGQGTSETDFKTRYNAVIDQVNTLTGAQYILCGIAQPGVAQDNVRQWTQDIVATNANAVGYVDMNTVFQALHYTTDQETADVAQALFNGINLAFFSSTANLSITGIPDGSFMTVLDDENGNRLFRGNLTYTSTNASQALVTNAGVRYKGYVDDVSNPSANGAYIEGVTV